MAVKHHRLTLWKRKGLTMSVIWKEGGIAGNPPVQAANLKPFAR